eukprot:10114540-Heterocapsa_arctica.AAC.1
MWVGAQAWVSRIAGARHCRTQPLCPWRPGGCSEAFPAAGEGGDQFAAGLSAGNLGHAHRRSVPFRTGPPGVAL